MSKITDKNPWDALSQGEIESFAVGLDRAPLAPLAKEIGRFLVAWSNLEQGISILLRILSQTPDAFDFLTLSGQLDIYSKCRALLALSGRQTRPPGWHSDLSKLCRQINGPLREERNRLVHDTWLLEDGQYTRLTYSPRGAKGDAPPSVVTETPLTFHEIRETCARATLAGLLIKRLNDALDP